MSESFQPATTALDAERITAERYRQLHGQAPASQSGGVLVALVLVVVHWQSIPLFYLVMWIVLFAAATGIRYRIWQQFSDQLDTDAGALNWHGQISRALVFSGCVWALSAWAFFVPEDPALAGLMIAIFACLIAGAIGALAASVVSYVAYCAPIALVLAARLLFNDTYHPMVPLGFMLFCVICVLYTYNMQNTITEMIRLRFDNERLIGALTDKSRDLEKAARVAEDANETKSRFLAVASHDLAQPLNALELFMAALQRERDPVKRDHLISNAGKSTAMLSEMFASLLDLSKLESEVIEPQVSTFPLSNVLDGLAADFQSKADGKQLEFEYQPLDVSVTTDPGLVRRIVSNLLTNALQYTPSGRVSLSVEQAQTGVTVVVADTGIGISEADQTSVFDEHFKLDQSRGLGIGLYLVKRLCGLLKIAISIQSKVGRGTRFSLSFPQGQRHDTRAAPARDVPPELLSRLKVVYVDDLAIGREAMSAIFEQWGCQYQCVDAPAELDDLDPGLLKADLFISDLHLGDSYSGLDLRAYVTAHAAANIPFLIVTGDTSMQTRKALEARGVHYLLKPVSATRLETAILGLA